MEIFKKKTDLKSFLCDQRKQDKSIGFVPTMGALHEGHVSLVNLARVANDIVVCSIFVNPTQFNQKDDLDNYPRTIEEDIKLINEKCDALFLPTANEMYEDDFTSFECDLHGVDRVMEGAQRPGHFDGVVTIVAKFFEIVNPHRAYFGEKDFQQLAIIRLLAKQHFPNIEVVGGEIIREASGLAMSSRNVRLTEDERNDAANINLVLTKNNLLSKDDDLIVYKEKVKDAINSINSLSVEYIEVVEEKKLTPISQATIGPLRLFVAVNIGDVRLIDNMPIKLV